jgi:perosamine synthetase
MKPLNYGKQDISDEDINAIIGVLKSDFLTQGPKIKEFEKTICSIVGAKYCVAVSNGTAALHLAVASLEIEKDKEGLTSPNSFLASANCMVYNEIKPGFVDIKKDTYCIDPIKIKERINKNTKLLIPVHFAGQVCKMKEIYDIARQNNLFVIEDAAHAIGSKYVDGTDVGNCKYSDLTIFSFHPVKTITTGEGGAITTNNKDLYERLLALRNHGMTKDRLKFKTKNSEYIEAPWYYEMQNIGFNFRMTDLQAALGISQISRLNSFVAKRREIVNQYNEAFNDIDWLITPYELPNVDSCFHLYILQIDFNKLDKSRKQVMKELLNSGIGTQVHYIPIHTQPFFQNNFGTKWGDFPIAEEYYQNALSIPLFPNMTKADINLVITNILNLKKNT